MNAYPNHIEIKLVSISEYPAHWHDSIEIIAVIKGSVKIKDGFEEHLVTEGDVILINTNDLHAIYNTDEDNILLLLNIDINYFESKYPSIKNTIIICDSNTDKNIYKKELEIIFLSILNIHINILNKKGHTYDDEIEFLALELLEYMINNFRYLHLSKKGFSHIDSNDMHVKALGGAMDYMSNNFTAKLTLQGISSIANFSKCYMSRLIKDVSGLNFTEYINMLRVEHSEKLLLKSRKSVSEIAFECGFSDVKYYNRHFIRWYNITPGAHRKQYLEAHDPFNNEIKYCNFNQIDALKRIENYLCIGGYDILSNRDSIRICIKGNQQNISKNSICRFNQFEIDFSAINFLTSYKTLIECANKELLFKTVIIKNLLHVHTQSNLNSLGSVQDEIIDILNYDKTNIIIFLSITDKSLNANLNEDIVDFFSKYIKRYGLETINKWIVELSSINENVKCEENVKIIANIINSISKKIVIRHVNRENESENINQIDHIYDTVYVLPHILKPLISTDNDSQKVSIKMIDSQINNKAIFSGATGLITYNGFKKASYYIHFLLSRLGDIIINKSDNYILTTDGFSYQVLLFNFPSGNFQLSKEYNNENPQYTHTLNKNFILNFENLTGKYKLTKYTINRDHGSIYDTWTKYGSPKFLSADEERLLSQISFPKVEFKQLEQGEHEIMLQLEPFAIQLLEITEI